MELNDLIQSIINNGLGVASFLALLYFMYYTITNTNATNKQICDTLVSIEKSLTELSARIDKIENNNKQDKF